MEVTGGTLRDLVIRRGGTPVLNVAGLTTDAECAVATSFGGDDERVYLLGASFVDGDGLGRQAVPSGSPYSVQRERGRWVMRPILDPSPE